MKNVLKSLVLFIAVLLTTNAYCQYTDVINSNRPGGSMSAFSVGKRVLQFETGLMNKNLSHMSFNNSKVDGYAIDFAIRYGLLKEQLELIWDVTYQFDELSNATVLPNTVEKRSGFLKNVIGAKYLIYDPIKDDDKELSIRSWKANYGFHWKDLIPAVSLYAGANLNFGDSPYDYYNQFNLSNIAFYSQLVEPSVSPKVLLATQSNFAGYWVLITNLSYNRIATDYPEMGYVITLTHAFKKNTRLSVFVENQGFKSDVYADNLIKGGAAYLLNKNFQVDLNMGGSIKTTPSQIYVSLGASFRIDRHRDELKTNKEKANKKLSNVKKKKKKKKKKKSKIEEIEDSIEEEE